MRSLILIASLMLPSFALADGHDPDPVPDDCIKMVERCKTVWCEEVKQVEKTIMVPKKIMVDVKVCVPKVVKWMEPVQAKPCCPTPRPQCPTKCNKPCCCPTPCPPEPTACCPPKHPVLWGVGEKIRRCVGGKCYYE